MRLVVQRVKHAEVKVDGKPVGHIGKGILIFLAVGKGDASADADYLAEKVVQLRMFEDAQGKMNLSCLDVQGGLLVVSQFTLYGDCGKGRRPSFDKAADPKKGEALYEHFISRLRQYPLRVETGRFRAMMDVALLNDGPVTFVLESNR